MTLRVAQDKKIANQTQLGGPRAKLAKINAGEKQTDRLAPETKQLDAEIDAIAAMHDVDIVKILLFLFDTTPPSPHMKHRSYARKLIAYYRASNLKYDPPPLRVHLLTSVYQNTSRLSSKKWKK